MSGKSLINPYRVPDELDLIRAPNFDIPNWSENLFFWAHDGASGTAVFVHLSRLTPDPRMWEGAMAVLRPNGQVFFDRTVGFSPDVADCGPMSFDCIEPNRRWRLRFKGTVEETTSAKMATTDYFPDAPAQLEMDILFDAVNPVWSLGAEAGEQDWAHFHTQQGGHIVGFVKIHDQSIWIDCNGFRDHSVGPRSYDGLIGNFWACCVFPGGRTFMAFKVWSEHLQKPMSRGFIATRDSIEEIEIIEAPDLESPDGMPRSIQLVLKHAQKRLVIKGKGGTSINFHLTRPVGMRFGYRADDENVCIDTHVAMEYTLDGETGYGWLERIRRAGYLAGEGERLE
jgi:hypothetical protein